MFSSVNKTFGCCSKIVGCINEKKIVVPNFVAVTKPFFSLRGACVYVKLGLHDLGVGKLGKGKLG